MWTLLKGLFLNSCLTNIQIFMFITKSCCKNKSRVNLSYDYGIMYNFTWIYYSRYAEVFISMSLSRE